jgi:mannose-6-phosphate isomerase
MKGTYKLQGVVRNYDWGGKQFIPQLIGFSNDEQLPVAEYWMGVHPSAPSILSDLTGQVALDNFIATAPEKYLGQKTFTHFGGLPFLFKILDVASMLSIQVHPSIENAKKGYALEEAAGIPLNASNRNYKDQNHKPEVMVALSDFWLLHGFLSPELLRARLNAFGCLKPLLDFFKEDHYQELYQHFMQLSNREADIILKPLLEEAVDAVNNNQVDKSHPHWWANKYYGGVVPDSNIDKGIFSIYILNIVYVEKYQGIFQGAGILHAYLEGQNIELMANSDNVLRGGLTPKHIDIKELLQHINFVPTHPFILKGDFVNSFETIYPCPVADFGLSKIAISAGESYTIIGESLQMLLITEGVLTINDQNFKAGEVALLLPETAIDLFAVEPTVLFKSYVP